MQSLILIPFYWLGANLELLINSFLVTLFVGLIIIYPLRNKKSLFYNILIWIFFIFHSWNIFQITAGNAWLFYHKKLLAILLGLLFALITVSTPYIIKFFKTKYIKWIYSISIIIIVGCSTYIIRY